MPSERSPQTYLLDIVNAIRLIERYVHGLSYSAFESLEEKQDAVERRLGILCEAADRLRKSGTDLDAAVDWRAIQSFGNVLRHEYDSVGAEIVWNIIQVDLPILLPVVKQMLRERFADSAGS